MNARPSGVCPPWPAQSTARKSRSKSSSVNRLQRGKNGRDIDVAQSRRDPRHAPAAQHSSAIGRSDSTVTQNAAVHIHPPKHAPWPRPAAGAFFFFLLVAVPKAQRIRLGHRLGFARSGCSRRAPFATGQHHLRIFSSSVRFACFHFGSVIWKTATHQAPFRRLHRPAPATARRTGSW